MKILAEKKELQYWLKENGYSQWNIEVASADASFRSYYRLTKNEQSLILMDSTLDLESLPPFINMNERLTSSNVKVPRIIVKNIKLGYILLEDFGSTHYFDILTEKNYHSLYKKAIDEIVKMQQAETKDMPPYDKDFLHFEMALMKEWYLEKLLEKKLTSEQIETIDHALHYIADTVMEQPQGVFVHRDFHSRNIMFTKKEEVGIIDFQDARVGAITYDLVSLLKDCYIEWDRDEVNALALYYRDKASISIDDQTFIKWFDFMGLQRHIKVLGIFSRLHLRDGKDGYLKDIPLTLKYITETASKYPETKALGNLLAGLA